MRELQTRIIADLNVAAEIEPAEEVRRRVGFLKDYLRRTGAAGFVLGISGGQDSSLAGRLAQLAVEDRFAAVNYHHAFTERLKVGHVMRS